MITPELISYIRGELGKGRKREEIRESLVREGGWSDADLSEAFRIVMPMQGLEGIAPITKAEPLKTVSTLSTFPWKKISMITAIVLVVGGLVFAGWFYRASLMNFWNSEVSKAKGFSVSLFGSKTTANTANTLPIPPQTPQNNNTAVKSIVSIRDCGIGVAPDMRKPATYQNDGVLTCLGNSALNCIEAKAVLNDILFPTVVQIVKTEAGCNFKLSYSGDSMLIDANDKKLASQYISCPINIVKSVDESKKITVFNFPSTDNLSKYAGQIYFYGTLGVFMETNLDRNKIQSFGCSGFYIDSVIASFRKMQAKQ